MTIAQAREVLAHLETATVALHEAWVIMEAVWPEAGTKAQRLFGEIARAGGEARDAADTCRVVLRMEERYAVRRALEPQL